MDPTPVMESESELEQWIVCYREDGRRVELICRHGVGHPSRVLIEAAYPRGWQDWMGVHGCDGCCSGEAFREQERLARARVAR